MAGDTKLDQLHIIFQKVMGWENYHLHLFRFGKGTENIYSTPDPYDELDFKDESRYCIQDLIQEVRQNFEYEYDFGDSWSHRIQLEAIMEPEEGTLYPRVLAGKRACPPEDSGGIWGYENYLEIIQDPTHEEHEDYLQWRGPFDPDFFNVGLLNHQLRQWDGARLLQGVKPSFTKKQGQYLAFIHNYTKVNGRPPAHADLVRYFEVTPPSVNQMLKKLESLGLIAKIHGKSRAIRLLVAKEDLPDLE